MPRRRLVRCCAATAVRAEGVTELGGYGHVVLNVVQALLDHVNTRFADAQRAQAAGEVLW